MARVRGSPPWSNLPPELLGLLFLRLPKRADRAFFNAVCRAWRSAARQCRLPPPSPVPWLVLPDGSATSFPHGETFQLPDGVRYLTSCGQWLFLSRFDGSCFLMDHFTKATVPLPSLSSCSYYQEPAEMDEDMFFGKTWMEIKDTGKISVRSLVVCSTCLVAAILAVGDLCTIALCRPGAAAWSVSAHNGCMWLSSMLVFFQGKLYAIDCSLLGAEHLFSIDIVDENGTDEPRVFRIEHVIVGAYMSYLRYYCYMHYLVESHGTLLMIRRNFSFERQHRILLAHSIKKFEVFEAEFEQRLWAKVRTLGNSQALFLGQQYCRAVHVSPYDVSRDCVFFLDDCSNRYEKHTTESFGVYDMKDGKVYSPLPLVSWKSKDVPATWVFLQCETDKLQIEGVGSQEIVESWKDPLRVMRGVTYSADASTLLSGAAMWSCLRRRARMALLLFTCFNIIWILDIPLPSYSTCMESVTGRSPGRLVQCFFFGHMVLLHCPSGNSEAEYKDRSSRGREALKDNRISPLA